jgi:hypothetical protein
MTGDALAKTVKIHPEKINVRILPTSPYTAVMSADSDLFRKLL